MTMESLFEKYPKQLFKIYDLILTDSFSKDFWQNGNYKSQRIKWKDARLAKKDSSALFLSWNFLDYPLSS